MRNDACEWAGGGDGRCAIDSRVAGAIGLRRQIRCMSWILAVGLVAVGLEPIDDDDLSFGGR